MEYRILGKTGLKVSALGFGAMRLPMVDEHVDYDASTPMLRRAFDLGVNYIDSAWGYCNGTSEVAVGKAIKNRPRDSVVLSTKQPIHSDEDVADWRAHLETQLGRYDTPYIDILNCHGLKWDDFVAYIAPKGGVLEQARKAQAEGLIRHLSFSCHDTQENMIKLIETGEFASITLQYNLLDRANAPVIDRAAELGVGVVVMGPVGGGRLAMSTDVLTQHMPAGKSLKSTPEIAMRFVLTNPGVTVALSGMNAYSQIEQNVATASRSESLSVAEIQQVDDALGEIQKLADLYCTGCGYCQPCPHGVKIAENFRLMNYARLYGLTDYARSSYAGLVKRWGGAAELCIECGECEPKCPQNIPIPEQLREVVAALG